MTNESWETRKTGWKEKAAVRVLLEGGRISFCCARDILGIDQDQMRNIINGEGWNLDPDATCGTQLEDAR